MWAEMAHVLATTPIPTDDADFAQLLEEIFVRLVGVRVQTPKREVFVERFSHGGMSSGCVCPAFWRDTAFPLLRARYDEVLPRW